ncbi:basic proline-rich protein-like [Microtus ochrogaster]|uniref:Basic proline-rich protein-like n=1 Tax=Microtus ochrogaster TaxID=79684 RepID=A0ABM1UH02_MICOH|nr:basic proline-rich protein-like [Microtus ochrogaster]
MRRGGSGDGGGDWGSSGLKAAGAALPAHLTAGLVRCPRAWAWGGAHCAPPPALWVAGSPELCLLPVFPQPPPPSPGTKRLRGGAEPAALALASGDGRAPSSDSSGQPPIRPQGSQSPCLASSGRLPPDQEPFWVPHPPPPPGLPPCAQLHTPPLRSRGELDPLQESDTEACS